MFNTQLHDILFEIFIYQLIRLYQIRFDILCDMEIFHRIFHFHLCNFSLIINRDIGYLSWYAFPHLFLFFTWYQSHNKTLASFPFFPSTVKHSCYSRFDAASTAPDSLPDFSLQQPQHQHPSLGIPVHATTQQILHHAASQPPTAGSDSGSLLSVMILIWWCIFLHHTNLYVLL